MYNHFLFIMGTDKTIESLKKIRFAKGNNFDENLDDMINEIIKFELPHMLKVGDIIRIDEALDEVIVFDECYAKVIDVMISLSKDFDCTRDVERVFVDVNVEVELLTKDDLKHE